MTSEDRLFVELIPKLRTILDRKAYKRGFYNYSSFRDDLIQDSFLLFRDMIERKELKLNENIDEDFLSNIIFKITINRFYGYANGNSPRYYDKIPNSFMLSIEEYVDLFGTDFTMDETLSSHSTNQVSLQDYYTIIKFINSKIKTKDKEVFNRLINGETQKEISKNYPISKIMKIKKLIEKNGNLCKF